MPAVLAANLARVPSPLPLADIPLPRLFILGAPKAGTTTLAAWWHLHPNGFTAADKEVQFFTVHHDRGLDWYRAQLHGIEAGQIGCDASPAYLYVPHALTRLRAAIPDPRLVVVLREPAARVWSHWCYFTALGAELRPFEAIVADAEVGFSARGVDYGQMSRYLGPLRDVVDRFGRDRLLVLFSDEMRSDRQGVFDRLSDHAGVPRAVLPATPDRNAGAFPRSARLQRLLHLARAESWPRGIGTRIARSNLVEGPPSPDPALMARLRAIFTPDLEHLEAWLGRPLPDAWTAPSGQ